MATETESVASIDLSDPAFWRRPFADWHRDFARLRAERPVAHYAEPESLVAPPGPGFHAITRYHDIVEISRRTQDFCSGQGSVSINDMPPEAAEFFGSMIAMDDPRHARIRGIVGRRFTPRRLQQLLDDVERTADEVIDGVIEKGEIDFVEELAAPFPLLIICDMMGIPRSEFPRVLHASNIILSAGDPEFYGESEDEHESLQRLLEAGMSLVELMDDLGAKRRAEPTEDLTSALVHAEADEDPLTSQEIASFFILLVVAGNETTRTALSHGMHYLDIFPEQRAIWQRDVEGVTSTAVEEVVRYAAPVVFMRRTATNDVTTASGHEFREGEKVVLFYGSGNRDEAVFAEPDRFDVRREPNPHIGFGVGPHFCLGAHLARRELAVMFRKIFERLPDIEVAGPLEPLRPVAVPLVAGIRHLPVRFTPGRPQGPQ